ncbi:MAG: hypothetical protein RMJ04_00765 [Geminicoccaceae bacterium]|nr:hypothetical protein [Geminicoccaceae bacterium]
MAPRPLLAAGPFLGSLLLASACSGPTADGAPTAVEPAPPVRAEPPSWPRDLSCRDLFLWFAEAVARGTPPALSDDAPIALLERPARSEGAPWVLDLPLPAVSGERAEAAECLLVLDPPEVTVDRRELARRTEWSERVAAVQRRLNPEYEAARRALSRLSERHEREERARARDLRRLGATDDPLAGGLALLGGFVLSGIDSLARAKEIERAEAELAAIPRWVEEEKIETYEVPVVDTELRRTGTFRLALLDRRGGRFWAIAEPFAERLRFAVAERVHPKDKRLAAGTAPFLPRERFEELARAPVHPRLSAFLAPLADAVRTHAGETGGASALARLWVEPAAPPPAADPAPPPSRSSPAPPLGSRETVPRARDAAAALVRVEGRGGTARGFYLGRHAVVTLRRVLGASSLVRVETAEGFATWGVPIEDAPAHPDLVLLHVPRAGPPLPLGIARDLSGASLPPAGEPVLEDGRVVAVSLDPEHGRSLSVASLAPFRRAATGPLD